MKTRPAGRTAPRLRQVVKGEGDISQRDPAWLKDRADRYLRLGDYKSAESAYSLSLWFRLAPDDELDDDDELEEEPDDASAGAVFACSWTAPCQRYHADHQYA